MTKNTWMVYALADSRSPDVVRYVGITCRPSRRLRDHKRIFTGTHKSNWIRAVLDGGGEILMTTLLDGLSREEATTKEVEIIAQYLEGGARLTNSTSGGDGVVGKTPEVRAKISEKAKAAATPDVVARLQEALRRPEVIERKIAGIRAAMTPEVRKRMGDAQRGKVVSAETRAKISEACKGYKLSDEEYDRMTSAKKKSSQRADNTSGYRGVSLDAPRGMWHAYININGKRNNLGRFPTPEDAARARDAAAISAYGPDCFVNLPVAANDNAEHKAIAA
ncbi:putative GIY-YIG superfamily endonuclease [Rhizobium leguminosarum]|uniref:NUMOD3 domain-containing DNA-binding protein n=1 Tax=Rhizobium leguminosarum TaxID=384 RepID=UPI0016183417|nr:AP2 domain-containing protein [Rhizobium leguminosarum]MBB5664752.1 putative GIY-YIG superfamily endonuclease [Rhizobium leguminosarum]